MSLSDETRDAIIQYAKQFEGMSHDDLDCSHFVYKVYSHFIPSFPYMPSSDFLSSPLLETPSEVLAADFVIWPGHVALIVDPSYRSFIGSQTSTGVAIATFSNGYWEQRKPISFRTLVTP
jgi:hypothetical protein